MKIKVYFTNGNAVVMDLDKTVFTHEVVGIKPLLRAGQVVVNWDEVSWIRKYEEPEE